MGISAEVKDLGPVERGSLVVVTANEGDTMPNHIGAQIREALIEINGHDHFVVLILVGDQAAQVSGPATAVATVRRVVEEARAR